jgi:hypothetical protein
MYLQKEEARDDADSFTTIIMDAFCSQYATCLSTSCSYRFANQ